MRVTHLLCLFSLLLVVLGCGGGGASGGAGGGGALFMTDSLDTHAHVWITIKKVVLTTASGSVTTFDDPAGKSIDLKTLRDGSGERYAFLADVPAGTYTGIQVTVDKTATLFTQGSSTGVTRVFAGNDGTNALLSLTFAAPRSLGVGANFALDFHLSGWSDDGTTITGAPFLGEGQGNGIDDVSRHEDEDFHGVVQGLSGVAPNQTFNLVHGGHAIVVAVDANTVVFNTNGNPNPALVNGENVELRGIFSTTVNALLASTIKIEGANHEDNDEVHGALSILDANAGTFTITVDDVDGFIPPNTTINIVTTPNTIFRSHGGVTLTQADWFAAAAAAGFGEAEGTFDSGTNTLAATRVKLEDDGGDHEGGGGHEGQVRGPVSNIDSNAFTFDLIAQEWDGLNIPPNTLVHVVTNGSTSFNHGAMTAAQFFAALANAQHVEVEGNLNADTSTLTAQSVKTEDHSGGH